MTRLFGCICNQPQHLGEALAGVRALLVAPPPVSRWGLGYVHAGEVLLTLHPRNTTREVDFHQLLGGLRSDDVIGWASDRDLLHGDANTQPFRYRRWMFAQEVTGGSGDGGSSGGSNQVAPGEPLKELLAHIPQHLLRNVRGKSASEVLFHLFLGRLHDTGTLDEPNLTAKQMRLAMQDTVELVRRSGALGPYPLSGNFILSNSRSMLAVRQGGPLWVRRLKHKKDPRRPESEFKAVLVVSSEAPAGESGFEEVPLGCALAINRDVTTDIVDFGGEFRPQE